MFLERLEGRELFSAAVANWGLPTAVGLGAQAAVTVPRLTTGVGLPVVAVAGRPFIAPVARLTNVDFAPVGYTRWAVVTWGDGRVSLGGLFPEGTGTGVRVVLGAHTYGAAGTHAVRVQVLAVPPAGTNLPVLTMISLQSNAQVSATTGGLSLHPRVGITFNGIIGTFTLPNASVPTAANINWGDGQLSGGAITTLSSTSTTTTYAVIGSHRYNAVRSFLVRISVLQPGGITTILSSANVLPASI
jgi:hypothetical protein